MSQASTNPRFPLATALVAVLFAMTLMAVLTPTPATADWLVTRAGVPLETDGPWLENEQKVQFTDLRGKQRSLDLAQVDLEASRALTEADPQVTLYSTSWCGYCRRTRTLLTELGVPFVEKDIEKSAESRLEYQSKIRGRGGVPVLDIDGTIVHGFKPDVIRGLVSALEPAAEKSSSGAR